ncbi:MAG: KEOPS complex subunit Cgi121 [Thermoplasmatota archaeon]
MSSTAGLFFYRLNANYSRSLLNRMIDVIQVKGIPIICDPAAVFDTSHISFALMHASRAILNGRARARDPAMEVMRWLAGAHQISNGSELMAPTPDSLHVLVIVLPAGWPGPDDGTVPIPAIVRGEHPFVHGLQPLSEPIFGGSEALKTLGLESRNDPDTDRKEVLEHISSLELDH